jgi:hypothetical protein
MTRRKEPAAIGELQFHVTVRPMGKKPNDLGDHIAGTTVEKQLHHYEVLHGGRTLTDGDRMSGLAARTISLAAPW